jgi:hypothetical protein
VKQQNFDLDDIKLIHELDGFNHDCPECGMARSEGTAVSMANHLIQEHHFILLHVGTRTAGGFDDGHSVNDIIYVVGKRVPF